MLLSIVYAVVRLLLDLVSVRFRSDAATRLEVVVLRQEVQLLRRRAKPRGWRLADRLVFAALSRRLDRSAWVIFPVRNRNAPSRSSVSEPCHKPGGTWRR